jgi:hypothetical protein
MDETAHSTLIEHHSRFSLRTLLIAITVVGIVLVPANWFGTYYLLPAALSLALVGASVWAYAAGRQVILFGLTIASAVLGFVFGLIPFAWHALLILFLSGQSLWKKAGTRKFTVAALLIGVVPFGFVYGPDITLARRFSALRRRYPMRSVTSRLEYERQARGANLRATRVQPAAYSAAVLADMEKMEQRLGFDNGLRIAALEQLHNATYRDFISRPGFGIGRIRSLRLDPRLPQLSDIDLPPRKAVELPLAIEGTVRQVGPELLSDVHRLAERDFLLRARIGYIRSRDEVAGFESHGFGNLNGHLLGIDTYASWILGRPAAAVEEARPSHWQVIRLELVGLLRHDEPRVYLSRELPRMDQLADASNRALDDFESGALPKIRSEENVVMDIAHDQIKMLGAIRAGNDCLQCHEGERGQLLGAFSYELTPTADAPIAE